MKTHNAKRVTQNAGKIRRYTLHATRHTNRGFTLLETLVSVFILTFTIVAPMSIASSTLFNATVAKEQVIAFYLAQEAIEGVRSIRDGNGLEGNSWLQGLNTSPAPALGNDFTIDIPDDLEISPCSGGCPAIKYDIGDRLYTYNSSDPVTSFVRTVRIDSVSSDEVSISVTVKWNIGKISRTFVARENIFNWQ